MPTAKPEHNQKVTRRTFIQYSALATGAASVGYAVTMKTDAVARADEVLTAGRGDDGTMSYPYQ